MIVKTVAGFANAPGGTLLIGVEDHGQPPGLSNDLPSVKGQNLDGLELALRDLFERTLGRVTASGLHVTFPELAGTRSYVDLTRRVACDLHVISTRSAWALHRCPL